MKLLLLALTLIAQSALAQEKGPDIEDLVRRADPRPEDLIQRLTEFSASATSYASRLTPERIRTIIATVGAIRTELGLTEVDRPDAPVSEGLFRLRFRAVLRQTMRRETKTSVTQWEDAVPLAWSSVLVMDGREVYSRCRAELPELTNFGHAEVVLSPGAEPVKVGPVERLMARDEICAGITAQAVIRGVPVSRGARIVAWMRAEGSALFVGDSEQAVRDDCKAQGRAVAAMVRPGAALVAPSFANGQIVYVLTAKTRDPALICTELLMNLRLESTPASSPLGGRELGAAIEALGRAVAEARELKPGALTRAISRVGDLELSLGQK